MCKAEAYKVYMRHEESFSMMLPDAKYWLGALRTGNRKQEKNQKAKKSI